MMVDAPATMIIRSVARRVGRPAPFVLHPLCQRALLSTGTTTTTTTAEKMATGMSAGEPRAQEAAQGAVPVAAPVAGRAAWGQRRRGAGQPDTIAQDYIAMTRLQRKTLRLGSAVERRYVPGDLLRDPPAPRDVTLELLMASQTHMGHHTSLWNPANARYVLGVRSGVHVIALEQTAAHLRRAARVVEEVAYRAGLILFVGTRRGQMDIVVRAAELAGGCHLFTKWTAGTITNRDQILRKAALRIVDENDVETDGGDGLVSDLRPLVPDLVVVLNPLENHVLLHECAMATIPTIGVIDTDADPARVTYAIPANDDSLRSVGVIAGVLGRAGEMGKKRRLRDAADGVVAWTVPPDLAKLMGRAPTEDDEDGQVAGIGGLRRRNWLLQAGRLF